MAAAPMLLLYMYMLRSFHIPSRPSVDIYILTIYIDIYINHLYINHLLRYQSQHVYTINPFIY